MAKGKTLWEMLKGKFESPVELQFCNPLKAKIGCGVTLDAIELRDYLFVLREIREYKRTINRQEFVFVDYAIVARPLNEKEIVFRLRLNPVTASDEALGLSHHVLLLRLEDELAYGDDFYKVVTDNTKKFQVLDNGEVTEEFYRINDVADSYKAVVSVLRDVDQDKKASKDEVSVVQMEYWDYWRELKDAAGQPLTEFLFIEMNKDNGWFQLWRGREMDPTKIVIT